MPLCSALGDEEPAGDLPIAQPEGDQLGYLLSPPRERHLYNHESILGRALSGASLSLNIGPALTNDPTGGRPISPRGSSYQILLST